MKYQRLKIDSCGIFYRETGNADAPALLLLHGFPTSSHMFRDLMPRLADRYHLVAPDLPGFGFSDAPARAEFKYTFDNLASVIGAFAAKIGLLRYALYVFDYGAPVGFRIALAHPERITATRGMVDLPRSVSWFAGKTIVFGEFRVRSSEIGVERKV